MGGRSLMGRAGQKERLALWGQSFFCFALVYGDGRKCPFGQKYSISRVTMYCITGSPSMSSLSVRRVQLPLAS